MHGVTASSARREESYNQRLGIALAASFLLHAILLFGLPAPKRWNDAWTAPHIGHAGPEVYLGELNPQDFPVEEQERLASARREAGAMVDEPVEMEQESDERDRILRQIGSGLQGRDRITNPVVELSEDWSVQSTSAPTSRTNEFTILRMVRPHYPLIAIAAGIEGLVKVQAWVDTDGKVIRVELLDSQVDSTCEDETIRAMNQWQFRPYRIEGDPIEFSVIVPFRFHFE